MRATRCGRRRVRHAVVPQLAAKVAARYSELRFTPVFLRRLLIHWMDKEDTIIIPALGHMAHDGWYSVLIGESNVAIVPAIGGYGVEDIYLGEFSPTFESNWWQSGANLT